MHQLYADELDPRAELLVGTAKPWSMGQGIDGGYDTCFLFGYQGMAGHPRAVLDRTYASRAIYECRVNGKPVGEMTLNVYLAGYFDASVTLVSGDGATCREACSLVPSCVTVKTNDATGRFSAKMLHRQRVQELLQVAAAKAMDVARDAKAIRPKARNEIDLAFLTAAMADMAELIPGTRRSGPRAVAYASRDYLEMYKALLAMVRIAPSAVPPEQ